MKTFPPQNHFAKALLLICVLTTVAVATSNSGTRDGAASSLLSIQTGGFQGFAFQKRPMVDSNFASSKLVSIAAGSQNMLPVAIQESVTRVPKMTFLFPAIGFLVAVSSTQILRRRRAAQIGSLKS